MNNKYTPSFKSMGIREQMKNIKESTYSELTEQTLKDYLLDIFDKKEYIKPEREVNKQENKLKDNGST